MLSLKIQPTYLFTAAGDDLDRSPKLRLTVRIGDVAETTFLIGDVRRIVTELMGINITLAATITTGKPEHRDSDIVSIQR